MQDNKQENTRDAGLTLRCVEITKTAIASPAFPWCRALLFTALAGSARTETEYGESVLREVLDEAGFSDHDIDRLTQYMRMTGWLT